MKTDSSFPARLGAWFVASALIAWGIQHLVYAEFVTRVIPKGAGHGISGPHLAYGFGAYLVLTGTAIALGIKPKAVALSFSFVALGSFIGLYLPMAFSDLKNAGLWTNAGKALAFAGCGLLVADRQKFGRLAALFIGAFFIFGGCEHFIYAQFVQTLVPGWIPNHLFWTYFSGVALIAGGIGMNIPPTARLAAMACTGMLLAWTLILHIPRALANVRDANETTAVFEALAMTGGCLLLAARGGSKAKTAGKPSSSTKAPSKAEGR